MKKNTLETRANGNITYSFATPYDPKANILYVNVVPTYDCMNSCRFCSRTDAVKGEPNIYEQKAGANLYLPTAPSVEKVVNEIESKRKKGILRKTREIAFVGLGEPLLQFELVRDSIKGIRERGYRGKIRIDTNGLVKSWYHSFPFGCLEIIERDPAKELKQVGLDEIRISVNATTKYGYQRLCKPRYDNAFQNLCGFVRDCIGEGIETKASFVTDFDDEEIKSKTPDEYKNFAISLGIKQKNIILRKYVKPIKQNNH
ncbi:hypothetical protein CEE44_03685 [Candidatus Woesearchaeota archaeon B3_Woes]|nr:MAG: hypothetical protein CEE44_03685 [Candidatus Woesearchaeota archaeon B3_Woes]